ncbi:FAD-linked oxidoreductase [Mytilinidion resinicola]|uniref:Proline dehydrogenase n=1 Tax=Mytilinidion resinicola TaxID=574789 RepID=A0A6A6XYP8_9PEZI|nr:FAD-linked oxidoreductase [Mytilinidion resinicola]KAF2801686.1 FAD-linked oxidoreductase [Mytilinidion resinicola]
MPPRLQQLRQLERLAGRPGAFQFARHVHQSTKKHASMAPQASFPPARAASKKSGLARMPTSSVLRSYLITSMSSSPPLLAACFAVLRRMLDSKSALMNVERNPVLNWLLKTTFYAQFCAGSTRKEVQASTAAAKTDMGYDGIILEFALEVLDGEGGPETADSATTAKEIETWRTGMLESVWMAAPGDFIGLKWSGLGKYALQLLKEQRDPTPLIERAIIEACDAAAAKKVLLLPGAEEEVSNAGIEKWTRSMQERYNRNGPGNAIMYTTYQCYLKSAQAKLAKDLAAAQEGGYTLGVKLVRGAYLNSEPRHLIWDTVEETHKNYDALAACLLKRQYGPGLQPLEGASSDKFPPIDLVLATHNHDSVRKAQAIRNEQAARGEERVKLAYAQLQGMADEISCELVQVAEQAADKTLDAPRVFKCMTWGTTAECLNFLLRRASENKDAAARTVDTRKAMAKELWRRTRGLVGLA